MYRSLTLVALGIANTNYKSLLFLWSLNIKFKNGMIILLIIDQCFPNLFFSEFSIAYKILIVRCHRKSCKLPRAILFAFYRNTWYFLSRCCGCNQGSVANVITLKMPCIAKTPFVKWVLTISWKNTGGQCGPFKFTGLRFL